MDKIIQIDGRDVKFRATAAVPRLYRILFRRDIMRDIAALQKEIQKAQDDGGDLSTASLEIFENVAYVMAKHADPENVPASVGDWLDTFGTFSIYMVFPEMLELWDANMATLNQSKKK